MLINDASITGSLIVNASSSFQNIAVSGNILPGINNVYNLGSVDKHFKEIFVSTGSINFVNNGSIATTITSVAGGGIQIGSVQITTSSISFVDSTGSVTQTIAQSSSAGSTSNFTTTASFNSYTSSNDTTNTTQTGRLSNLETKSASVDISVSNINSFTASNGITSLNSFTASQDTKNTTLGSYTGSIDTKWTSISNVTSSLIAKTGSYATTGSNSFYGTQVFSGSVYIANDLVVQGSSSIQYISASSVSIGTNIIQLNTANPSVRFAGLTMIDSGSVGGSGSFLYDSLQDEMIFVHRGNGSNVTSSHFVLGPETYDSLGNELYLTANRLTKGTGKEHLVDSCIYENSGSVGIGTSSPAANYRIHIAATGSSTFLGISNQGTANGDRQLRIGFGGNGANTHAELQGTRLNVADDVNIVLQPGGGNIGIGTTSPSTLLHVNTTRSSGANVDIMTLSDNVTGVQTSGFGVRILATSNNGQAKSAIAFEADGGTNNDTAIAFYTQNSAAALPQRLIIDKNGTVRVNTSISSTNYKFGVSGSAYINGTNNKGIFVTDNATYASIVGLNSAISAYNPLELRASGTDYQLYLATNGKVGIGTSSPTKDLHICGGTAVLRVGPDYFVANGSTDRDYIDLIADGSTTQIVSPNEMFRISNPGGGAGSWCIMMIAGTGGVVLTNGSTSWASASDLRLKNINSEITNATSKLNTLRAINFSWKTDINNKNNVGLIAQEVEKVFPEVISYDSQVDSYGIRYTELIPVLVKSIQEQHCIICSQASMINTLKTCLGIN